MAIILTDFRIFRKIITKICDIFFSQKIGATLYQSKPVISSTPSLNVDRNCRFFIQPVGRASSLSCKTINDESLPTGWMKLKIAARPAGWPTWRRSSPWSSWSPSCCSSSVSSSQPSRQGAQSAVRTRMRRKRTLKMWYLTENGDNFDRFLNFHKKIINWWHFFTQKLVPFAIEFSRINKNFYKKITKIGDNLLIENVTKIGEK